MEQLKDNLKQSLLENLADWLNSECVRFEISFCNLEESEECHIKMCDAAFDELVKDLFHPEKLEA